MGNILEVLQTVVNVNGHKQPVASALESLLGSPSVISYDVFYDENGFAAGAIVKTSDNTLHSFQIQETTIIDNVKTIKFFSQNYFGGQASFSANFDLVTSVFERLKSHTNIQVENVSFEVTVGQTVPEVVSELAEKNSGSSQN